MWDTMFTHLKYKLLVSEWISRLEKLILINYVGKSVENGDNLKEYMKQEPGLLSPKQWLQESFRPTSSHPKTECKSTQFHSGWELGGVLCSTQVIAKTSVFPLPVAHMVFTTAQNSCSIIPQQHTSLGSCHLPGQGEEGPGRNSELCPCFHSRGTPTHFSKINCFFPQPFSSFLFLPQ